LLPQKLTGAWGQLAEGESISGKRYLPAGAFRCFAPKPQPLSPFPAPLRRLGVGSLVRHVYLLQRFDKL